MSLDQRRDFSLYFFPSIQEISQSNIFLEMLSIDKCAAFFILGIKEAGKAHLSFRDFRAPRDPEKTS